MSKLSKVLQKLNLKPRLNGDRLTAFLSEFLTNSGHFLILKSLEHVALYGWYSYVTDPTQYVLIGAMSAQTAYLSGSRPSRLFGNLIGVSLYTLIDSSVEVGNFFEKPSHIVFWVFSLAISLLAGARERWKTQLERWIIPLESILRMLMLVAFYVVVGLGESSSNLTIVQSLQQFTEKNTHVFLTSSLLLVGLLLGFQRLQILMQQQELMRTSKLLRNLAEWGMGIHAVDTFVRNPQELEFQRCDRAVLFMDIRGFTNWCEQNDPNVVASALNSYYQEVESAVYNFHPLRVTLVADEIMAIYATPQQAVSAAQAMQKAAREVLSAYGLGAGCAVHCGDVVEGLFGGKDVRTYTVIGDIVNTAKRLEGATAAGEITISDVVYERLGKQIQVKLCRTHDLKGKTKPFKSWVLLNSKVPDLLP